MAYLAPAGTVMSLSEIARGLISGAFSDTPRRLLVEEIRRTSGLQHCWPICSGRAAMTLILRAMRTAAAAPECDEVLIPAYTCYSVAASIARAGLRPRLCDVDPRTLGMDSAALDKCDFSRVLAVVSSNLYGLPNALSSIEDIARRRGVFMLDDAAQALGARLGGRAVGAFGDAGLYSFDKGKIICTIQGGAIVSQHGQLSAILANLMEHIPPTSSAEAFVNSAKLPIYAICLHPTLYGIVKRLPFLGLGRTQYETRYPIADLADVLVGVAAELMKRLNELQEQRRRNAEQLTRVLGEIQGVILPAIQSDAEPAYARFPLLVPDPHLRDRAVGALDRAGIGATGSYPRALADVPEVVQMLRNPEAPMPGARQVAAQIVTLPTHGFCPPELGDRVRDLLVGCLPALAIAQSQ